MPIKMPKKEDRDKALLIKTNKISAEQKAEEFIKAGGTVPKLSNTLDADIIRNFNIKILESTLNEINSLRENRPKSPYSKKSLSLQKWIIEAIEEKIKRDKK